ncbi:nucleotide exchange factor GrpE [bacterium AH-315-E10]|nr:nucleotide exchange factor GrpE [bacterium AH-315-E10]
MAKEDDGAESTKNHVDEVDKKKKSKKKPKKKSIKEQLSELQEALVESQDQTLRVRAEYDNYRKRMGKDLMESRDSGKLSAVNEMLTVVDYFQMAKVHAETSDDIESIKQGIVMILNEFTRCFDNLGITTINANPNDKFDPNIHEGISSEVSDTIEANHIISQAKAGFRMGERVIRAASVTVSSGKEEIEINPVSIEEPEQEETI